MYRQLEEDNLKILSSRCGIDLEVLKCWARYAQTKYELATCIHLFDYGVHEDKLTKALQAGVPVKDISEMWSELTPEQRASSYINQIKQGSV